jgi:beta-1,4-mannosyl-glycoprotein beta-1,4-N-acetylglucosaminyltransferase
MQAYSHSDRLGDHPDNLLRPERIQKAICEGLDIFDMLPEAYSYLDLFSRWKGSVPGRKTAVSRLLVFVRPEYYGLMSDLAQRTQGYSCRPYEIQLSFAWRVSEGAA